MGWQANGVQVVGGSNPLAPTNQNKELRAISDGAKAPFFVLPLLFVPPLAAKAPFPERSQSRAKPLDGRPVAGRWTWDGFRA